MDWVPSHFPDNEHGLRYFDGTYLFEHADPKSGFHPEWHSYIFNYGRHEVRSFLLSSALFWLEKVPPGWTARGCSGVDALSRLWPEGR
jgi:1,4-alpha-glucan branching enzyme